MIVFVYCIVCVLHLFMMNELNPRRSRSPLRSDNVQQREQSAPSMIMLDYTDLKCTLMPGKRETSKLLHVIDERQLYLFRIKTKCFSQYNCYVKSCPAKVQISFETGKCSRKGVDGHNHGPNEEIESMKLKTAIKKRCRSVASATRGGGDVHAVFTETIRE